MSAVVTLMDAERFIGLEYVDGQFDCADLVVVVQRELFGRNLPAPASADRARGVRGQARDLRAALATYVRPVDVPATGCAVLLWETTPHGAPPLNRRWHLGTVFMHLGQPWVLHCANESEGTRLQPLDAITGSAMHFESFLAWR